MDLDHGIYDREIPRVYPQCITHCISGVFAVGDIHFLCFSPAKNPVKSFKSFKSQYVPRNKASWFFWLFWTHDISIQEIPMINPHISSISNTFPVIPTHPVFPMYFHSVIQDIPMMSESLMSCGYLNGLCAPLTTCSSRIPLKTGSPIDIN